MLLLVALALASEPAAPAAASAAAQPVTACMSGQLCDGRCIPWTEPCPLPLPAVPAVPLPGLPDAFATCGAADPAPAAIVVTHAVAGALCNNSSDPTCTERATAAPPPPPTSTCTTGSAPGKGASSSKKK
jgi:hypothetical protein